MDSKRLKGRILSLLGRLQASDPRTGAFSHDYGRYRGGSIDRYYIDAFIKDNLAGQRGRFLEFGRPTYRKFVDPPNIESYDILDIDSGNKAATIRGDVQALSSLTERRFDVIICTQVLQYLRQPQIALREMHQALAPGGLLLLTVPFISKADRDVDRWRFTKECVRDLLADFSTPTVLVRGNLFASMCYWTGLGLHDVSTSDLDRTDAEYYCVVLATARKPRA